MPQSSRTPMSYLAKHIIPMLFRDMIPVLLRDIIPMFFSGLLKRSNRPWCRSMVYGANNRFLRFKKYCEISTKVPVLTFWLSPAWKFMR